MGFVVNMIGLFFFHDHGGHNHGGHSHGGGSCDHHKSENMQGA
jgi:zinc transporter 1